jgi:hypothetical protein
LTPRTRSYSISIQLLWSRMVVEVEWCDVMPCHGSYVVWLDGRSAPTTNERYEPSRATWCFKHQAVLHGDTWRRMGVAADAVNEECARRRAECNCWLKNWILCFRICYSNDKQHNLMAENLNNKHINVYKALKFLKEAYRPSFYCRRTWK